MFLQDKTYLSTKDDSSRVAAKLPPNALDTLTRFPRPKPANATPPIPIVETVRKRLSPLRTSSSAVCCCIRPGCSAQGVHGRKFGKNISGDVPQLC